MTDDRINNTLDFREERRETKAALNGWTRTVCYGKSGSNPAVLSWYTKNERHDGIQLETRNG